MPNIHYHEVEVSRYPLFEYPPYDLALATRMAEVAEIYDLDLLHVHYAIPHSVSAMLARQMLALRSRAQAPPAALRHHAARHRHHAGRRRSVVSADHALLHRPERRRHFDLQLSEAANRRSVRRADADPGDSQLRELRSLPPHAGGHGSSAPSTPAPDEKILVHLSNFRPVKRIADVIEIFDRVQKKIPARLLMIGDGPERSRAEWLAVKKGIHNKVDFLGKQDRIHEKLRRRRRDAAAQRAGVVRTGRAGGHGLRGGADRHQRRRRAGGDRSRQDRLPGGGRRRGHDGRTTRSRCCRDDDEAAARWESGARHSAQARFCASKIIPMYEKFYREVLERAS